MADDDTPTEPVTELPDIRVVSIFHDADQDRLAVVFDDDLDPHHALGLLVHGMWVQLQNVEMGDLEYADDESDDE